MEGLTARVRVVAEPDDGGGTRLACLRSSPPVALRQAGGAVFLVGTAGGPLGGDRLHVELEVGAGCELTVRTSAATVVLPGPAPSHVEVEARIGPGGVLRWLPEPTVAAAGCRHRMRAVVEVAGEGRLVWWGELVLGRHGEPAGTVSSRLAVDVAAGLAGPNAKYRALLRQQLDVEGGPGSWDGPAVLGGAGAVGGVVMVDPAWSEGPPPASVLGPDAAVLPLAGPGAQVTALAAGARGLRARLDEGVRLLEGTSLLASAARR